jgi:hypothetical protein
MTGSSFGAVRSRPVAVTPSGADRHKIVRSAQGEAGCAPECRMASASAHPGEQHRLTATNSIPSTRRLTASNYERIYPAMMGKTCNGMLKLYYLLVYFRRTRTKYVRLLR